jgi:hypothetical protein
MSAIERCNHCGKLVDTIEVHGHTQCSNCKTNTNPCCSGERNEDEMNDKRQCNAIDGTTCCTD